VFVVAMLLFATAAFIAKTGTSEVLARLSVAVAVVEIFVITVALAPQYCTTDSICDNCRLRRTAEA